MTKTPDRSNVGGVAGRLRALALARADGAWLGSEDALQRELALIKVKGAGDKRVEALRVSEIFRAKVIDTTTESFIFEITGASEKVDAIIDLMRPLGLVEVSRTGVLSIRRGGEGE